MQGLKFVALLLIFISLYSWWSGPSAIKAPQAPYGLEYEVSTLGGASPRETLPLIIVLHGDGDTGKNFLENFKPLKTRCRIISFHKTLPDIPYMGGYRWNFGSESPQFDQSAQSFSVLLPLLIKKYPTQGKPLLVGFSSGAVLSYYLALHEGSLFSNVFPVAGYLSTTKFPASFEKAATPQIWAYHGVLDEIFSIDQTRMLISDLKEKGIPANLSEYASEGHRFSTLIKNDLFAKISQILQSNP